MNLVEKCHKGMSKRNAQLNSGAWKERWRQGVGGSRKEPKEVGSSALKHFISILSTTTPCL